MDYGALTRPTRAVRFWARHLVAVVILLGAGVTPCRAELLTWSFSGRLNFVSPELAPTFAVGDAVVFVVAFETATPASGPTSTSANYPSAIRFVSMSVKSYAATMTNEPSGNFVQVFDNFTGGFFPLFDGITFSAPVTGPPVGGLAPSLLQINFGDTSGSALSSTEMPSVPPNLSVFSPGFQNFALFFPGSVSLGGDITGVTTQLPTVVGPPGPQGAKGDTGATGATGATGSAGPTGPQGAAGPTGAQGPAGPGGPQGGSGVAGAAGPQGAQGVQGAQGSQGPAGPQGDGLMSGGILFLPAGSPAPHGYTFVGTFDMQPSSTNRGRGLQVQLDMYRHN